jgi:hypothetical protein
MKIKLIKNKIIIISAGIVFSYFSLFGVAFASEISAKNIIDLVNQTRAKEGVETLLENEKLDQAAQSKAEDMIKNNYFSHNSPGGVTPWVWFEKAGYDYQYAGENLAMGFSTVENQHKAWLESPTHRKNIVNPKYSEIGVAVAKGEIDNSMVTISVQLFGTQAGEAGKNRIENNLSDEESEEKTKEQKETQKGVILNMQDSGSGNQPKNIFPDREQEPKINIKNIWGYRDNLFKGGTLIKDSIWVFSATVLFLCLIVNAFAALLIFTHYVVVRLRGNKDIFMLIHSLLILLLVGSIIF